MGLFRTAAPREEKHEPEVTVRLAEESMEEVSSRMVLPQDAFMSMLYLERRRAERSQKRYVLLLVELNDAVADKQKIRTVQKVTRTLCSVTRETDVLGWYVPERIIGIIATEIGKATPAEVRQRMTQKFRAAFSEALGASKAEQITVSFHFFPEDPESGDFNGSGTNALYPEFSRKKPSRKLALGFKRAIDITGSAMALIVLSPLLLLISLVVKLTSAGPVLFSQERLGLHGKKFRVLKFRSMRPNCDTKIHQEYVKQFIAGNVGAQGEGSKTFKIQGDPRVTTVGSILRKTSLDELPQFWNVLVGEMSLVGPRPPLEYEFRAYDMWHRRRVLEIKPGITGLWQVEGRSRTQFDDMVRLDLQYAKGWSLWLDLKILLRTPAAVVSGDGAH